LNTHKSENLVLLVTLLCDFIDIDLGAKGRSGVLKNMETRQQFLTHSTHHIRFIYMPKTTELKGKLQA